MLNVLHAYVATLAAVLVRAAMHTCCQNLFRVHACMGSAPARQRCLVSMAADMQVLHVFEQ